MKLIRHSFFHFWLSMCGFTPDDQPIYSVNSPHIDLQLSKVLNYTIVFYAVVKLNGIYSYSWTCVCVHVLYLTVSPMYTKIIFKSLHSDSPSLTSTDLFSIHNENEKWMASFVCVCVCTSNSMFQHANGRSCSLYPIGINQYHTISPFPCRITLYTFAYEYIGSYPKNNNLDKLTWMRYVYVEL